MGGAREKKLPEIGWTRHNYFSVTLRKNRGRCNMLLKHFLGTRRGQDEISFQTGSGVGMSVCLLKCGIATVR